MGISLAAPRRPTHSYGDIVAPEPSASDPIVPRAGLRPRVFGKFLFVGSDKLYVRGTTYGAFGPGEDGCEFQPATVEADFAAMAANGCNAVRIPHTVPPRWVLDAAQRHGLWVMVGLSAEQYVGYLIDRAEAPDIDTLIRERVRTCSQHPALLCYALGNEIPASLARWIGARRIERFLAHLYRVVKDEDPDALVTYVNYPSTEYLQLPFLDFVSFNVYLEAADRLAAYVARLQNIAGNRPLLMTELGLDSFRNGELAQAKALDWQVRTAFAGGCCGAFVFSWTDDWYRGGAAVEDWAFGLTDRQRRPKPALATVRQAFADAPFPEQRVWPRISVVVCSYNGSRTICDCLDALQRLEYPNFEVIVVDDGSTDHTAGLAARYDVRLVRTPNRGLSSARNTGARIATGEIVAYIDDDAWPDPHWLRYLAETFTHSSHAAVGGPNIPPPDDGLVAEAVANAPGGPIHVLTSDNQAEHIPGCNFAVRKSCLDAIGGFDPQFRAAGDDVDACWRLEERGWTIGFHPGAVVWHHRRNSVRGYWRQQVGYGRAEALLERKWPTKYNALGHYTWAGRVYSLASQSRRGSIFHGTWGNAPFQSIYQPLVGLDFTSIWSMPEAYLLVAALAGLTLLGLAWLPLLLLAAPLFGVALLGTGLQAGLRADAAVRHARGYAGRSTVALWGVTALLYLAQPLARLRGRLGSGLTPWRWRGPGRRSPRPRSLSVWSRGWRAPEERLAHAERMLRALGISVLRGGDFDRWDLGIRGGLFGSARLMMAVEDTGQGTQFVRFRAWPRCSTFGPVVVAALIVLGSLAAATDACWVASAGLVAAAALVAARCLHECAVAMGAVLHVLEAQLREGA